MDFKSNDSILYNSLLSLWENPFQKIEQQLSTLLKTSAGAGLFISYSRILLQDSFYFSSRCVGCLHFLCAFESSSAALYHFQCVGAQSQTQKTCFALRYSQNHLEGNQPLNLEKACQALPLIQKQKNDLPYAKRFLFFSFFCLLCSLI